MFKLTGRVYTAFALLMLVAWAAFAVLYYQMVSAPLNIAVEQQLQNILVNVTSEVDHWVAAKVTELQTLAQVDSLVELDLAAALPNLRLLQQRDPDFEHMSLADLRGTAYPTAGERFSVSDRTYYQEVLATGQPVIGDPVISRATEHAIIPIAVPLRAASGSLRAVLIGTISVKGLDHILADKDLGSGYAFLTQQDGLFVFNPDESLVMSELAIAIAPDSSDLVQAISNMADGKHGKVAFLREKQRMRLYYAPLATNHWSAGVLLKEQDFFGPLVALRWVMLGSTGLVALLILGGSFFLAHRTRYQVRLQDMTEASNHLLNLFRDMHSGVITTDAAGAITTLNPLAQTYTGWSEVDARGQSVSEVVRVSDGAMLPSQLVAECLAGQKPPVVEQELFGRNGGDRQVLLDASSVYGLGQEIVGSVLLITDITSQRVNEKRLNYYELLAGRTQDIILVMDQAGRILEANTAAVNAYGYPRSELIGLDIRCLRAPETLPSVESQIEKATIEGVLFETWQVRADGNRFPVEVSSQSTSVAGRTVLVSITHDISERYQVQEKIRYLSFHDRLTGLHNRTYLEEELARLAQRGLPATLILGDVNGLKLANDAFGHQAGDELLQQIAGIITECAGGHQVARWGGDEFVMLLPQTTEQEAELICECIWEACRQAPIHSVAPSLALGVATKFSQDQPTTDVWRQAEDRMYRNKLSQGRGVRSALISSLRTTLSERSHETEEHCIRMKILGSELAKLAGLSDSDQDELQLLALLHDLGKVAIPDHILLKPSQLTGEEWDIMRQHPEIGFRIAQATPEMIPIANAILAHHERWDGGGYPLGLAGEEIPRLSRMIAILDAFDVMTHDRVYRQALSKEEALQEIATGAGAQFDPELVRLFLHLGTVTKWDELPAESE